MVKSVMVKDSVMVKSINPEANTGREGGERGEREERWRRGRGREREREEGFMEHRMQT